MGNSCTNQSCPSHPHNSITRICLCESCLEPLCEDCIIPHNNIHAKLGYPSIIKQYDPVKSQFNKEQRLTIKKKQEQISNVLAPTSLLIKNMTREYFERYPKNSQIAQVLSNLQIWNQVSQDPEKSHQIHQFLKNNLIANKEIVGNNYTHLY